MRVKHGYSFGTLKIALDQSRKEGRLAGTRPPDSQEMVSAVSSFYPKGAAVTPKINRRKWGDGFIHSIASAIRTVTADLMDENSSKYKNMANPAGHRELPSLCWT